MKHSQENVIKVLRHKFKLAHKMADINSDDKQTYSRYIFEATAYWESIELLSNKKYFDDMVCLHGLQLKGTEK